MFNQFSRNWQLLVLLGILTLRGADRDGYAATLPGPYPDKTLV
jgi:hypothetical protein